MDEFLPIIASYIPGEIFTTKRYMKKGKYIYSENINKDKTFLELGKMKCIGIGFGEDYTFTQETIDIFQNRLVDFMAIPLPRYRGGAHWTWAMLNEERYWGCCIQLITPEMRQGEFDNGKIVMSEKFGIPKVRKPQHLIDFVSMKSMPFLKKFVERLMANDDFELEDIDESKSEFYPRLDTESDAQIDWTWYYEDVERFIKAFDDPYMGAWALVESNDNTEIVRFKDCEAMQKTISHPYLSGLIFRVDKYIWVYGNGGILRIGYCSEKVKVGDRFI